MVMRDDRHIEAMWRILAEGCKFEIGLVGVIKMLTKTVQKEA
jgi:hypothetical protein